MKTTEELNTFYKNKLYFTLKRFEKQRKDLKIKVIFLFVIIIWNTATIYFFFFFKEDNNFDVLKLFLVFILIVCSFLYNYLTRDYKTEFKHKLIKPLIKELDSNLKYSPASSISKETFNRSLLFPKPDRYDGNDLISGLINSTKIYFSDVHAVRESSDNSYTIFQGIFIVADFYKNFYGNTIILPDHAQKKYGNLLGSWFQSKNLNRDELIKMDNLEFEKEFVVYSTDQVEARYILSHSLMEKILNYKRKSKKELFISFINNHLHIGIHYGKDLFEPVVFSSLLDNKLINEYTTSLHLAVSIVEELKLNQKLWSKK
ncbi:DUF3137 domain-containing protein [Arcobacter sp. LA11]|uniref:DUF3137 domain-containing protein n=1 Tax=Arcobacter sp. LA11 TaxID=1898176 RepID=UPI00093457FB|nr:DUF3137 domain-containing protein [Arcobacter sp. LA11]